MGGRIENASGSPKARGSDRIEVMIETGRQLEFNSERYATSFAGILRRRMSRALLILCLIAFFHNGVASVTLGQQKQDMPWYDAEKQGVAPVKINSRPESSGSEHQSVPDYVPPSSSSRWNTNGAAGTGAGTVGGATAANLGSFLSILVWIVAILIAIAMLGLLVWAVFGGKKREIDDDDLLPTRTMAESIKQLPFEIDESLSGDFRSLAYRYYQQGDLRRATILLFSHVLVSLDQKGFVRLKKGKTNRQYLRELNPHQMLSGYFGEVMVRFEEAFFGDREIERSSFESCWNRLDDFQAGLEANPLRTEG